MPTNVRMEMTRFRFIVLRFEFETRFYFSGDISIKRYVSG